MNKIGFIIAMVVATVCFSYGFTYGGNIAKGTIQESAYIKE